MPTINSGFNAMLSGATVSGPAAKQKKGVPLVKLDAANSALLASYLVKKKNYKQAETDFAIAESPLLSFLQSEADKLMFSGKTEGSLDVVGDNGTDKVKFIMTDKFSVGDVEAAKAELGATVVDALVEKKLTVTLKEEVLADPNLQNELTTLLGANFAKFFEVKEKMIAVDGAKQKIYDQAAGDQTKLDKIRIFVKPAKPSIK
jgi:hypothetical protein